MEKKKLSDDILLQFLDGNLSEAETDFIQESINENNENQVRLRELEIVHEFLKRETSLLTPSTNFTEKVIKGLHKKASPVFLSPKNGFLLIIGLLIASLLALSLLSTDTINQLQTNFNFKDLPLNIKNVKMPSTFTFNMTLFIRGFVIVNLILAFILLDRTILRPIFQKRSNMIF
ncbi:MAG TPA: hypothetical protein DGG95_04300 [Cytophagales bacterium]|jgi:hypothetical protein|nr:hypothetical protein [Cytophagales bacterium]